MIRFLDIRRLAIIDALQVEFHPGLNVVTGENGAGKSVLVGAVGLLLGGRASSDLVRTGEDHARVQAVFDDPSGRERILRRDIAAQGRSRAFIDDALATSGALRALSADLVDLHGQHEHQRLLDPSSHLDLVDSFGDLAEPSRGVAAAFEAWRSAGARLARAERDAHDRADKTAALQSRLQEIERVAPRPSEDDELAAELRILRNADTLQRLCSQASLALYEGDDAVLGRLRSVWRDVAELAELDERFNPYVAAREGVDSQIEDLAFFLRSYAAGIEASPQRLQDAEDRLATLERLKRKHRESLAEIVESEPRLRAELEDLEGTSGRAAEARAAVSAAEARYLELTGELSRRRREAATQLARALEGSLAELAMAEAVCEFRWKMDGAEQGRWTARGTDDGELYVSSNPGEEARPLVRIASGGELSRIALALKTLAVVDAPGKTLVFDEVDAGIGGHVADVVGQKLAQLAERYQVICITHLPQIAAYASHHFRVTKTVVSGRTVTGVEALTPEARTEEIARMIGGAAVSERLRITARELLSGRAGQSEQKPKGKRAKAKGERVG